MCGDSMTSFSLAWDTDTIKVSSSNYILILINITENPVPLTSLKGVRIVAASCGSQHTALLSDEGEVTYISTPLPLLMFF